MDEKIEITVNSWEEFEEKLKEIQQQIAQMAVQWNSEQLQVLYRGHANSNWKLETTLERAAPTVTSAAEYYRLAYINKSEIESFTGNKWEITGIHDYRDIVSDSNYYPKLNQPGFDYLTYLRHHGFPSPLMDWTKSPYIAAFFAFNKASVETEFVSIFIFLEDCGGGKAWGLSDPALFHIEKLPSAHSRHFNQQSEYTVCTRFFDDTTHYSNHEDAFSASYTNQDLLWKINIPTTERKKVLAHLNKFNLT